MKRRITYHKPLPGTRLKEIATGLLSAAFFKRTALLLAYYVVNYVNGYRLCQKGNAVNVHPTVILRHPENIELGDGSFLNHNNVLQAGKGTAKIRLGRNVMTGPNVMMFAYNHGMERGETPMIHQDYFEDDIEIGDDVWIGAGSILLAGAHIGTGAVIAAGSVVRGEVEPYSIYGGAPARKLKSRL